MKPTLALLTGLTGLLALACATTSQATVTAAYSFSETISHDYGVPKPDRQIAVAKENAETSYKRKALVDSANPDSEFRVDG